jgi:hypothetical protein
MDYSQQEESHCRFVSSSLLSTLFYPRSFCRSDCIHGKRMSFIVNTHVACRLLSIHMLRVVYFQYTCCVSFIVNTHVACRLLSIHMLRVVYCQYTCCHLHLNFTYFTLFLRSFVCLVAIFFFFFSRRYNPWWVLVCFTISFHNLLSLHMSSRHKTSLYHATNLTN